MKRKFAGTAIVAVAAAILATPVGALAAPLDSPTVAVDFDSAAVSPELGIHGTIGLLDFIASDQPKTIVIDTDSNAVTSITG